MAITAPTLTTGFNSAFLQPELSAPIFEAAARTSVAQRLFPQVPLGINGQNIPIVTGRAVAEWVSEGGTKPATQSSLDVKTMVPKKLAAIAVVSAEVVRANPGNFMNVLRNQLGEAFAIAFDSAVFHGTATPFANHLDQATKAVEIGGATQANGGVYGDFVNALDQVISDTSAVTPAPSPATPVRRRVNGWALDSVLEPNLLGATDTTGRPLFVETQSDPTPNVAGTSSVGRLLGRSTVIADYVATNDLTTVVGYGGDFSQGVWGVTSGINYRVSTEATVTVNGALVSLWEKNLVAILAEAEYGFLINDLKSFVRFTNATGS